MIERSARRNIIFGVSGGISEATGLPVWWVRLALIALQVYIFSWTWLVYLIAGIFLPIREESWEADDSQPVRDFLKRRQMRRRRAS